MWQCSPNNSKVRLGTDGSWAPISEPSSKRAKAQQEARAVEDSDGRRGGGAESPPLPKNLGVPQVVDGALPSPQQQMIHSQAQQQPHYLRVVSGVREGGDWNLFGSFALSSASTAPRVADQCRALAPSATPSSSLIEAGGGT